MPTKKESPARRILRALRHLMPIAKQLEKAYRDLLNDPEQPKTKRKKTPRTP